MTEETKNNSENNELAEPADNTEVFRTELADEEEVLVSAEMLNKVEDSDVLIVNDGEESAPTTQEPKDTEEPADAEVVMLEEEDTAAPTPPQQQEKKKGSFVSELIESAETFCYALVMMVVLFVFVFRFVTVQGESMRETLQHDDKLIISDLFYTPSTGDVVVIDTEGMSTFQGRHKYIIKRVIATEGQKVSLNSVNWTIWVDGVKLTEKYVYRDNPTSEMIGITNNALFKDQYGMTEEQQSDGSITYTFTVPEDMVFVMGDNRQHSSDSRAAGCMEEYRLLGRVLLRISPEFGGIK